MKRFLISIITCCCLVSSISANSLLFTPHHVSSNTQIGDNITETGVTGKISFHVDADGKSQSVQSGGHSLFKIKQNHPFKLFFWNLNKSVEYFSFSNSGTFSHVPYINISADYHRIILFPFHDFL